VEAWARTPVTHMRAVGVWLLMHKHTHVLAPLNLLTTEPHSCQPCS
jgi:hypothetical protein